MGIFSRIKNITNASFRPISENNEIDFDTIFFNEKDEELKRIIDELNKQDKTKVVKNYNEKIPKELLKAFTVLEANEKNSLEEITFLFKNKLKEVHPDKNPNLTLNEKKILEQKTLELIESFNIIKKYKGLD